MGRLQSCKRVQWVGRVSVHIQGRAGCRCVLDGPTRRRSVKKQKSRDLAGYTDAQREETVQRQVATSVAEQLCHSCDM